VAGYRIGLIVLQGTGALSIIPYPFILIANVMSIAANGQTPRGAVPYVLLSLYPAVWIALDAFSWRALGRGSIGWAFALSIVPVAASLIGVAFWVADSRADQRKEQARLQAMREKIERANPLAWSVMCFYAARYDGTTPLGIDAVLKLIAESPRVNDPVPEYGTPLRIALWNLNLKWDGTPGRNHSPESLRIVRALVAHGARLSGDERAFLPDVVRLKLAMLNEPVDTERENPLVWRIVRSANGAPVKVGANDVPLLNKPTRLYGTPLLAALLLLDQGVVAGELIEAGAHLSREEERDPAGASALELLFRDRPGLQSAYRK